jgi:DNA-binding CsgD family transcriptional regulator
MKQPQIISYIHQLCRLGLGGQVIMPELVKALHDLLPSQINCFLYTDKKGQLTNLYSDRPSSFQSGVMSQYKSSLVRCLTCPLHKIHCAGFPEVKLFPAVWKPFNHHFLLNTPIIGSEGVLGSMQLYRCAQQDQAFTLAEQYQLKLLSADIALGVQGNRNQRGSFVENGDRAMVVCDRGGKVLSMSRLAEELLFLASHASVTPDEWQFCSYDQQTAALIGKLCQKLTHGNSLRETAKLPPSVLQNNWGKFSIQAFYLEPYNSKRQPLIGISLERQVPLALRLAEAIHAMPLSSRQKQVCQLLTYGCSNQEIAARLQLSPYTIADHVKAIYEKLEVHHREGLLDKLKAYTRIEPVILNVSPIERV